MYDAWREVVLVNPLAEAEEEVEEEEEAEEDKEEEEEVYHGPWKTSRGVGTSTC